MTLEMSFIVGSGDDAQGTIKSNGADSILVKASSVKKYWRGLG